MKICTIVIPLIPFSLYVIISSVFNTSLRNFWYNFVFTFYVRSAVILDVVAISALIIYVTRVALGYKQTWDRYQVSQFNTSYVVLKMIMI